MLQEEWKDSCRAIARAVGVSEAPQGPAVAGPAEWPSLSDHPLHSETDRQVSHSGHFWVVIR